MKIKHSPFVTFAQIMLSASQLKLIRSLHLKKNRVAEGLTFAEGDKLVKDLLGSNLHPHLLLATAQWIDDNAAYPLCKKAQIIEVSEEQMKKISALSTPSPVLFVFKIPELGKDIPLPDEQSFSLVLENIRDPGNLGTIIRSCDWFGHKRLILSETCADVWSPKTIQSSMGSISRIEIFQTNLNQYLTHCQENDIDRVGTFMEGENLRSFESQKPFVLIIGNEGSGISQEAEGWINRRITIPFAAVQHEQGRAESLNAAISAGICLYEISAKCSKKAQ